MNRERQTLLPADRRYSGPRSVTRSRARLPQPPPKKITEAVAVVDEIFVAELKFDPRIPSVTRIPTIPGALNISELAGNEIVAIGIVGSITAQTTTADIAALASGGGGGSGQTYVKLGTANSYTLPDGTSQDQRVGIKDNLRRASAANPIIINGKIDGGTSLPLNIAGSAIEFVWDVPSGFWMVF